jgi:phosphate-selective porin OprO/OprP
MKKLLLTTAMVVVAASPAYAGKQMSMEEMQAALEKLSGKVEELSATVQSQNHIIEAQKTQIQSQDAKLASISPAAGGDDEIKIKMGKNLKIESADGKYSFQPLGRVHLDFTHFQDDRKDHPDGANFRRARLGFRGDIGEDFNYKAELDFGGEAVNFKDVYLAYTGFEVADFWLGNFKPPLGLEQNTSSNYMEFVEQAPVTTAFTRDEIIGFAAKGGGENWSLSGGIFNEDASVNTTDDESWSFDARGSVDLLQDSPNVLHLGLGGSYRTPNATTESVTLSGRPAGTGSNMITTGAITNVDSVMVGGVEAAAVFGPFSAQGEYLRYDTERSSGSDPSFDGWYAQASYFLTGESRPYKGDVGNFDRVKPKTPFSVKEGGWGAWEILARADNLDLNDEGAGVTGGEMNNYTLGVNWYLRDNIRMMFNYVDVNTDEEGVVADDDPQVMTLRTQWDF